VPVRSVVACGGLPERSGLLMQVYADVIGREIELASSPQTPALGSAIFGAVAAGVYPTVVEAAERMGGRSTETFRPSAAAHAVYDELYREYRHLHDLFGTGADGTMKRLKRLAERAAAGTARQGDQSEAAAPAGAASRV
jgi:L-ribulokinase